MIKRYKRTQNIRFQFRVNERITAPSVRVLDPEGKQIGIFQRSEALQKARDMELDLVEIASHATPPVVRIINFNKFLYQEEKKKREEKRKAKVTETKEIRLGPFMNDHDLNVMIGRGRDFLEDGNKVRLVLKFIGRQIVHPEFGQNIMKRVVDTLSDVSKVERDAHFEGKQLISVLSPERKKTHEKEKNQEISNQTV